MRTRLSTFLFLLVAALVSCRSRVVEVTLVNTSSQPVSIVVVDYPGATFGVNTLTAGATYRYAIKPQGTGPLKVQFADAEGHSHNYTGPALHKNDEGSLTVKITQDGASSAMNAARP